MLFDADHIIMYRSADNSHVKEKKMIKINIIPISIKYIGILMVLSTSMFVVELYFFYMNFRDGAADIVSWSFVG